MISLDPADRPAFDTLLHTSRGTVFPECFYSFLYNYVSSVNELSSESLGINNPQTVSHAPQSPHPPSMGTVRPNTPSPLNNANEVKTDLLPSDSDHRLERIWADYESIEPYILPESNDIADAPVKVEYTPTTNTASKPFEVRNLACETCCFCVHGLNRTSCPLNFTFLIVTPAYVRPFAMEDSQQ